MDLGFQGLPRGSCPRSVDPETPELRVYRGGSFADPAVRARSAFRFHDSPGMEHDYLGVRPARTIRP